jgi:hypothetical protein
MSEDSLEAPQADAAEQDEVAAPGETDTGAEEAVAVPLESDEADAAEQARAVPVGDDDDYR